MGELTPIGWTAEQTSWRKPGSVSSADRMPPPIVGRASISVVATPARARMVAAVSPLGPSQRRGRASRGGPARLTRSHQPCGIRKWTREDIEPVFAVVNRPATRHRHTLGSGYGRSTHEQEPVVEAPHRPQQFLAAPAHEHVSRQKWWIKAALALAFWTGLGLLFSTQSYLLWPEATWMDAMQIAMPRWYVWGLLAPFVFAADRRLLGRMSPVRRILTHVPLGMPFILVAVAMHYGLRVVLPVMGHPDSVARFFLQNVFGEAMVYALIVGASLATSYAAEARQREQEAAELALHSAQLETHLAEARLRVLQSQLNPHFLFNTFNTISAFTETDPKTARRMMARLGTLLRSSLDHAGRQEVTLAEELTFLEDYLTIERLRFEDRLTVDVRVEEDVRNALVPSFILQPLVENAIRHGTGALLRNGHVHVSERRVGDWLTLVVEDDGIGLPEGWRLEDHAGVGLSNIARRLEELYGSRHRFVVADRAKGGVRVEISLPFRRDTQVPAPAAPRVTHLTEAP
ncbi:MAG: hypothetical protein GEU99_02595 [Luteitalea sp.]|nr:hypothetical protein [Luteitalea sp.]